MDLAIFLIPADLQLLVRQSASFLQIWKQLKHHIYNAFKQAKAKYRRLKSIAAYKTLILFFFFDSYCRCILDLLKQLFAKIVPSQMFEKVPNTFLWIVPVNTERNHIPKCHVTTQSC